MTNHVPIQDSELDEAAALRSIVQGTATETGERFFQVLVQNLAAVLGTFGAWVTEYVPNARKLTARAFWLGGEWVPHYEYEIDGTPCESVIDEARPLHVPGRVITLYPDDPDLGRFGAVSYMGVPLTNVDGSVIGHLAVLDKRPLPAEPRLEALMQIFAARAAAELQRLRAEAAAREREEKLRRLVGSAMDAIIELDGRCQITMMNPAGEKLFGCQTNGVRGANIGRLLTDESRASFPKLVEELAARPEGLRSLWIPGGLHARRADGAEFPAEATLSCYAMDGQTYYTVILRNVNERLRAERKIAALASETEYLREEIQALQYSAELISESRAMRHVFHDIREVAETDATVLILGETGTGKELVAKAIHAESRRREQPLIKVNCGAVTASLVESEFFGHEKGAFTGATQRRAGQFAIADGGTIFLDEIGELSLDLQVKLLRVLQEGEFEPVGSSQTRKVDVRVIAATNRDLEAAVADGSFREDLYYRLNVFPILVPPLRDRGDDVVLLAAAFAERMATRLGRDSGPLSPAQQTRLRAYDWPGNVRELANVIERAVITSRDGRLNLERALPETRDSSGEGPVASAAEPSDRIRTDEELRDIERQNMIRALEATGWKVAGPNGAARLLDMRPSTLHSRMKAFGIRRPPPA